MKTDQYIATFPAPLVSIFRTWLQTGWIPQDAAMGSVGASPPIYGTIGQFFAAHLQLSNGEERAPVLDFLDQRVLVADGRHLSVRESLRDVIKHMTAWLVDKAVERLDDADWEEQTALRTLGRQKLLKQGLDQFTDSLLATFDAEVGDLRVFELFRRRRHEIGLASWSTYSDQMLREANEVGGTPSGRLHLGMSCVTGRGAPVEAIEWVAGVRGREPAEWLAVVSGMVYAFKPQCKGRNRSLQLLRAADEVSSGDKERAQAFVNAHKNPEEILGKGDIAFVWEWERRHGTAPGTGLECLAAVCDQMRRRHENLRSIVLAISPERFAPRAANEPPVIAEARLADLDKLHAYVLTIGDRLGLTVYVTVSDQNDISPEPEIVSTGSRKVSKLA